jgi:hypothetical protein
VPWVVLAARAIVAVLWVAWTVVSFMAGDVSTDAVDLERRDTALVNPDVFDV